MQNGIQIWLNQLNSVEIAADGQTATIGGGTLSHVITSTLWAAGKQTGQLQGNAQSITSDPFALANYIQ
jgi:AICAR transformylase/IMP cyclohydrolase PurH